MKLKFFFLLILLAFSAGCGNAEAPGALYRFGDDMTDVAEYLYVTENDPEIADALAQGGTIVTESQDEIKDTSQTEDELYTYVYKKVWVDSYTRVRNGKTETVSGHYRYYKIKIPRPKSIITK
jgi:hypothetical protein